MQDVNSRSKYQFEHKEKLLKTLQLNYKLDGNLNNKVIIYSKMNLIKFTVIFNFNACFYLFMNFDKFLYLITSFHIIFFVYILLCFLLCHILNIYIEDS